MFSNRADQLKTVSVKLASIATDASAIQPAFAAPAIGQIIGMRYIASTSQPSATTVGSALAINVYKNASNAGSVIGSFNTSGTGVAANTVATIVLSTTVALTKFAVGDVFLIEEVGGAAMGSTLGAYVNIDMLYGYEV